VAARVLPLTVSRSSGYLGDASKPDPRFAIFPDQFAPAISRCCAGKLSNPLDIVPPPCTAKSAVYEHVLPNPKAHEVLPMKAGGFRGSLHDVIQKHQMHLSSRAVGDSTKSFHHGDTIGNRLSLWESEASRIPIGGIERLRMWMSTIGDVGLLLTPRFGESGNIIQSFL